MFHRIVTIRPLAALLHPPSVVRCIGARRRTRLLQWALVALPVLGTGCSTSRNHLAHSNQPPAAGISAGSDASESIAADEPRESPPVRTIAFRHEVADATSNGGSHPSQPLPRIVHSDASSPPTTHLTLETVEQLALESNPAIQQAATASARAGGIRTQVGLKPNPTIGYFGEEIGNEGAGGLHGAFVSQTFVRGDKLAWNRQVINHDVRAMNLLMATQQQRVVTDVRLAFYDALAAQKRLQLARDFREIAAKGVEISEERVTAKVGTRPDVLQSEIQLNEVDLTIQQAEFQLQAALTELGALCGGAAFGQTSLVGELANGGPTADPDVIYAQIVADSPFLAAAQTRVERARANLQRQQVQPVPNVTTRLGTGYDDGTGDEFANVQLSIPLPVHNKNQGNIQAARAEYCNAIKNVERIEMSIRQQLARVTRESNVAQAMVLQYEQSILPKAEETLSLIQQAQAAGEFDFLRVLTARRAYFDANLEYVSAMGRLAQANAKIDGMLLSGGLSTVVTYDVDDGLRDQALNGQ